MPHTQPCSDPTSLICDVLVGGSGAGGLATAITASALGLDVILCEKEDVLGGTTAYSAGVIWIPGNRHQHAAGIADSVEGAFEYLKGESGAYFEPERVRSFVDTSASALEFLESNSEVRFVLQPTWADYHPDRDGASSGGRSLLPVVYDGRRLGPYFGKLRPPIETMMLFGGMMVSRDDLPHLFGVGQSLRSAMHVARMVGRYARDRISYGRGTRLANGNALVARMVRTLLDRNVPILLSSPIRQLHIEDGRVAGADVESASGIVRICAQRAVVLACGGFPANGEMRASSYEHVRNGRTHHTLAPPGNVGDGLRLGGSAGGEVVSRLQEPAAWVPVSLVPQSHRKPVLFPHFVDRGKPGFIVVDRRGRRFVNETLSYHDFVAAMIRACADDDDVEAFVLCDRIAFRRFGIGAVVPLAAIEATHVRSGYLKRAATLADLAGSLGVNADGLEDAVATYNRTARTGKDMQFNRGADPYQRFNGSPHERGPNPCVAPIEEPPFYAVRMVPGDIGTFIGLKTDAQARVLGRGGEPVAGLYAVGNDMASIMGGSYPGAGITLGPALTFGYIAARDIASSTSTGTTLI